MPVRSRSLLIPLTPAEERALIKWAKTHERTPVGQVRWLLRDLLQAADQLPVVENAPPEPATAA